MGRLSRAELQERNRARVLAAARTEFAERGFRDARVDDIAERAGLTRGAVYSNFPGKRALYFAVLADLAEHPDGTERAGPGGSARGAPSTGEALGAFARAWVARLPLGGESADPFGMSLMAEIAADERVSRPFAQLMRLDAVLLGLALENLRPAGRSVHLAETVLTTLQGASGLAGAAPGFVEPFTVIRACERLAGLDLGDAWPLPHIPHIPPALPADAPWSPPETDLLDAVRGVPARVGGDGVVAILGLHRLEAAEEAVRAAPPGATVTAALVTGDPAELMPLARLVVAAVCGCLRRAFPPSAWPRLQLVYDATGALAAAAGASAVSDTTETAVRVEGGRIVARADGHGACHAAASAGRAQPGGQGLADGSPATSTG
jgi:AcrR family transcriptional regulator